MTIIRWIFYLIFSISFFAGAGGALIGKEPFELGIMMVLGLLSFSEFQKVRDK